MTEQEFRTLMRGVIATKLEEWFIESFDPAVHVESAEHHLKPATWSFGVWLQKEGA